jgi:hypothetical protein
MITLATATAIPVAEEVKEAQQKQNSTNGPSFCMTCSPVNLFAGFLVSFHALLGVLLCEFLALFLCYFPASLVYHAAQIFAPPNACTGILYSSLMIVYYSLALCDSIVLFVSVIVTETLAVVGYVVGALTGGIIWAQYWHQQIRRMCHGIRIVFRNKTPMDPPRHFVFGCFGKKRNEAMDQHTLTAEVVPVPVQHTTFYSPTTLFESESYDIAPNKR